MFSAIKCVTRRLEPKHRRQIKVAHWRKKNNADLFDRFQPSHKSANLRTKPTRCVGALQGVDLQGIEDLKIGLLHLDQVVDGA